MSTRKNITDKILKALGSAFVVSLITGILANLIGLKVEYSCFQSESSIESRSIDTLPKGLSKETVRTSNTLNQQIREKYIAEQINDQREVIFIDSSFAYTKHKWWVRLLGFMIIAFPFFLSPLDSYFEEKKFKIELLTINVPNGPLGRIIVKKIYQQFLIEYLSYSIVYMFLYIGFVFLLYYFIKIDVLKYSLLLYENFINYIINFF